MKDTTGDGSPQGQPGADASLAYQQALEYGKDLAQVYAAERAQRQELQAAHQLLRAVFASTPDGLVVVDAALIIRQINPAFVAMLNLDSEEILHQPISSLPSLASIASLCEDLERQGAESARMKLTHGSPTEESWMVSVARLDANHLQGWVMVFHDQTQRKLAEEALQRAHDELEQRVIERTAELQQSHLAEQHKARELAVIEERHRLARELHDAVSQTLWSASLLTDALPGLWEIDIEEGRESLDELRLLIHGALAEMRTLLVELRPERLVEKPLDQLLRQLTESVASRTGLNISTQLEPISDVPASVRINLYRIGQEALTNIVKHSGAKHVQVRLSSSIEQIILTVADDGRGFNAQDVPPGHMGLSIMRERAEGINADLSVSSVAGQGTEITVHWRHIPEEGESNNERTADSGSHC